jgi:release factor glutamine methyltransferase
MAGRTAKPGADRPTVRAQLIAARSRLRKAGIPNGWLDAELLLAHVMNRDRVWLHTNPETRLAGPQSQRLGRLLDRRAAREPLAYLTGEREFYGHHLRVTPVVLIPRPETETLVEVAIEWLKAHPGANRVIDLGTGSGAIAIAIAAALPAARVRAIDLSDAALEVARGNIKVLRLARRIKIQKGNLLERARPADLIVANLPYLRGARRRSWPRELHYEPRLALEGGEDGLRLIEKAVTQARGALRPGGCMLLECDPDQVAAIKKLAGRSWTKVEVETHRDLAGRERVIQLSL